MNTFARYSLTFLAILCVLQCSKPTSNKSTPINIAGKVLDQNGNPVSGVVVHLINTNLYDTTNSNGSYSITSSQNINASGKDSVSFSKNNQIISFVQLSSLTETINDLRIIQRNIYGTIDSIASTATVTNVAAILSTVEDSISPPKVATLWYNKATLGYSGYAYFIYSNDRYQYSAYVNIYIDSLFSGRSSKVVFPDYAGDIQIPAFSPFNAIPIVVAGHDTAVGLHDSIRLHGTALSDFIYETVFCSELT